MISLEVKKKSPNNRLQFCAISFCTTLSIYQTYNAKEIKYVQLGPKNDFEIKSKPAMLL